MRKGNVGNRRVARPSSLPPSRLNKSRRNGSLPRVRSDPRRATSYAVLSLDGNRSVVLACLVRVLVRTKLAINFPWKVFLASCYSRGISDINMFAENVDKFFFRGSLGGERKKKKRKLIIHPCRFPRGSVLTSILNLSSNSRRRFTSRPVFYPSAYPSIPLPSVFLSAVFILIPTEWKQLGFGKAFNSRAN